MSSSAGLTALLGADWQTEAEHRRAEIVGRIADRTDVVLFGAGYLGRHARRDLKATLFRPVAFVDNGPALWGTEIDGLPVLEPAAAAQQFGQDALWLITVYTNSTVINQCRGLGVPWVTCAELSWVLAEPRPPSFIFGTPDQLAVSADQIIDAASVWADADSVAEYLTQVRWRFLLDYSALRPPRSMTELYFPGDLVRPLERETFVDCGAFTGDTIEAFLATRNGQRDRIVAIEPDPVNRGALEARLAAMGDTAPEAVRIETVAVGAERGTLKFESTGTAGSTVGSGSDMVQVAPLDELLEGWPPTYIKFDVEGAEHAALAGGASTIRTNQPVLAVCLYHRPEDLWDLPLLIRSIQPDYKLYVRRHSDERWETVCYAVPPDRLRG